MFVASFSESELTGQSPPLRQRNESSLSGKETGADPIFVGPFCAEPSATSSEKARIDPTRDPIDASIISKLMPLLTNVEDEAFEYTLSYLMNKRALFASSLGSGPESSEDQVFRPLTFLMVSDAYNSWQLGRLLYRIHRAGVARIAATMYFEALRTVGTKLRGVEQQLEESPSLSLSREPNQHDLEGVWHSYTKIEKALDKHLGYGGAEPLSYRIDRSRYYVKQFERMVHALRIDRVEGFQPYNEFIEQRQGSAFALIDLLGKRYERIKLDRSLLLRRNQAVEAQRREEEIEDAQRTADIALFIVLGPYYGARIAEGILTHFISSLKWHDGFSSFALWLTTFVFGLCAYLGKRYLLKRLPKRNYAFPLFVLALFSLCAFVFFLVVRSGHEKAEPDEARQADQTIQLRITPIE